MARTERDGSDDESRTGSHVTSEHHPSRSQPDPRALKAAAKSHLRGVAGVEGVGLGDGTIRVYVLSSEVARQIPTSFQGVPIEVIVSGQIGAQRS